MTTQEVLTKGWWSSQTGQSRYHYFSLSTRSLCNQIRRPQDGSLVADAALRKLVGTSPHFKDDWSYLCKTCERMLCDYYDQADW